MHSYHCHLRKSLRWYHNWHNHPRHHHGHWAFLVIFSTLITSYISQDIRDFYFENEYKAQAQGALTLGISGDKFTVNGQSRFLLFASYFDAMAAPDTILDSDFSDLRSRGFDGIRIFPNWNPMDNPNQLMDGNGALRPGKIGVLQNILQKAEDAGLIVDISFTRDTVSGLSPSSYINGIESTAQQIMAFRGVFFDLQNEADHDGSTCGSARMCPSQIRQARDRVKSVDPGRIVTVSAGNFTYFTVGGLDFWAPHDPRFGDWPGNTDNFVNSTRSSLPAAVPIHLQEPERYRGEQYSDSADDWFTASRNAKCAGAAGWTFHNGAGYDLAGSAMFSQFNSVEHQVVDGISGQLNGIAWDSCRGSGGSLPPPPGGGSGVTGPACSTPGYVAVSGANASGADPAVLSPGWFCDDDTGIYSEVSGISYPVQAILTCTDPTGTAWVADAAWDKCNDNPGWDFSTFPPTKLGQPVQFIATVDCPGTVSFTLTSGNITAGAWTQSPSTAGDVCVPGTPVAPGGPPPSSIVSITSVTPNAAAEGATVTITGQNLDQCDPVFDPARCNVQFFDVRGARSTVTGIVSSPTSLTAQVAVGLCPGVGSVRVGSVSDPSNPLTFTITSGTGINCTGSTDPRYINFIYPTQAHAREPILIAGENLDSTVRFYNASGIETIVTGILSVDLSEVTVAIPSSFTPGFYTIRVGTDTDNLSNSVNLEVIAGEFEPLPTGTEPPIITGINPLVTFPGGTIEIFGEFLTPSVQFIDLNGMETNVTGWVSADFMKTTVAVPRILLPGIYTVGVSGPNGSATSSEVLTILEGEPAAAAAAAPIGNPNAPPFEGLLTAIYNYSLIVVGIAVFIMILWGGFLWMTSAANPGNIATAKRYIYNAIIGAVLLLSSYVILRTINPELVGGTFRLPGIEAPAPVIVPPGTIPQPGQPPTGQIDACAACSAYPGGITAGGQPVQCTGFYADATRFTPPIPINDPSRTCPFVELLTGTELIALRQAATNWVMSEGFPPTVSHADTCHGNGTCVDITLSPRPSATAQLIQELNVLCGAIRQAGFSTIINEYTSLASSWPSGPTNCPAPRSTPFQTGEHLHIER